MKKFLVLTALAFGMFLMASCGGSDMHCEKDSFDGSCGDKTVEACSDGHSAYYKVDGKKFNCNSASDCSNTIPDLIAYCGGNNNNNGDGNGDDNNNVDVENGMYCGEPEDCPNGSMKVCSNATEGYYEVNGERFEYTVNDLSSIQEAERKAREACGIEEE